MSRGFSLVEVALTMAIVSALAAVAIPSLASWRERHVVIHETKRLQRTLERAYTVALLRDIVVAVSLENQRVNVTTKNNLALNSYNPHPDVTVQLKSKDQRELIFYPSHTATPTTVLVSGARVTCSVIMSLRGRTRRECP